MQNGQCVLEKTKTKKEHTKMKNNIQNFLSVVAAVMIFTVTVTLGQKDDQMPDIDLDKGTVMSEANDNNSIAGTWYVLATPDGPPPFRGLITFSEGGGMIASAQGDNLTTFNSLATPGHGAWTRTGNREFLFTFIQILYNGEGEYDGEIRIRHNAVMNKAGTHWNGFLTLEVFNPAGDLVFTGTGSGTATRIVPLPLLP
jgi:hypothetical protein